MYAEPLSLRLLMDHNLVHSRGVLAHFDLLTLAAGVLGPFDLFVVLKVAQNPHRLYYFRGMPRQK